jgi:ATP-dependent Clp protease ATP-binding subunit ClpA
VGKNFSDDLITVLARAGKMGREAGTGVVPLRHLWSALADGPEVRILRELASDGSSLDHLLDSIPDPAGEVGKADTPQYSVGFKRILGDATRMAEECLGDCVTTRHIVWAVLQAAASHDPTRWYARGSLLVLRRNLRRGRFPPN